MATKREFVLKPGNHQFAAGSHAIHNNDNTSDEECAWYLEKYPHIASLFEKRPKPEAIAKKKKEAEALIVDQEAVTKENTETTAE
jgi:hypothetical protein